MAPTSPRWIRILFLIAGLYDGVLGLAFLLFPKQVFELHKVEPPNHDAYVQFPALLLLLFALMFFRIAANPVARRELILYGCGLKVSYCAMVFGYQSKGVIPFMWVPWAWADLAFLALFLVAWLITWRAAARGDATAAPTAAPTTAATAAPK
jgi:hypothetical protein